MADVHPGLRDELLTSDVADALRHVDEELVSKEELDPVLAPERLARHLAAVARRFREGMGDADASAAEQARVINRAAQLLADGEPISDDAVTLPPFLVTGIREPAEGLGTRSLPPRPAIPLSENELGVRRDR